MFITLPNQQYIINFTVELQNDEKKLNFLDLTLKLSNTEIEFNIFRKSSHTGNTIHTDFFSPFEHKQAAFKSYVNRLLSVPLKEEAFNKELRIIKQIADNNGFNGEFVDQIIGQVKKKTNY